jgi:glycosyltransferase involved in cell wall biosynthesis
VENQTYNSIHEWVIIDGSKTQEDSVILQQYWKKLTNFRCTIIISPWQRGAGKLGCLRNIANNTAKGDFIAWMDDDDYYQPQYIEYAVAELSKSSDKLIAGCAVPYIYDVYYKSVHQFDRVDQVDTAKRVQSESTVTMNSCMVYKKEYLTNHSYADLAESHEEIHFTNGFTEPMIQLNPMKTMLLIHHSDNVLSRSHLIHSSHFNFGAGITATRFSLTDLVTDTEAALFYDQRVCGPRKECPYDIVYFCGAFSLPWTPHDTSLGGSEQAVVQLSEEWTKMGKKVCVYGDLTLSQDTKDEVDYFHYRYFNPNQHFKTIILWRFMGLSLFFTPPVNWYVADKIIVDLHDNLPQAYDIVAYNLSKIDKIVFKSKFHVQEFETKTGMTLPWNKVAVILNGIQTSLFTSTTGTCPRDQYRFCYTSSYTRGLLEILDLWKEILKLEPRAELHIYYGIPVQPGDPFFDAYINAFINSKNVCEHGRMSLDIVAEEKRRSNFHLYPTNTIGEVDCIAIRESLVAGCIPILSYNRVFKERDGYFITGDMADSRCYPKMAQEIISLARDSVNCEILRTKLGKSRTICTWKDTAKEWLSLI